MSGVIFQCFENEIFDDETLRCVYNNEQSTPPPTTTITVTFPTLPTITTSTPPQVTTDDPLSDDICENLFFDFIEHPTDCGLAIFCFEEAPIIRECPKGEIFDIRTEQ